MTLDAKIEALLFWKGDALSVERLAHILAVPEAEIIEGIAVLESKLASRGILIIKKENEIMLGTAAEMGTIIEKLTKEELIKDLGKAGLETLSIILYRGPVVRRDVDYIRGVNSQFIIRNLLIRGLIEKMPHPDDQRTFLYKPTFDLLAYLGLHSTEELPEYKTIQNEITAHSTGEESLPVEQQSHE